MCGLGRRGGGVSEARRIGEIRGREFRNFISKSWLIGAFFKDGGVAYKRAMRLNIWYPLVLEVEPRSSSEVWAELEVKALLT